MIRFVFLMSVLALGVGIAAMVMYYQAKRSRQRAEERQRLLDRLGSGPELREFLASEAGQRLLQGLGEQPRDPRRRILLAVSAGVFSLLVGAGHLLAAWLEIFTSPGSQQVCLINGLLATSVGAGLLAAAGISAVIVRKWRLVPPGEDASPERP